MTPSGGTLAATSVRKPPPRALKSAGHHPHPGNTTTASKVDNHRLAHAEKCIFSSAIRGVFSKALLKAGT
jgi:hypothetical protein